MAQSYQINMPEGLFYTNRPFYYTKQSSGLFHPGFQKKTTHIIVEKRFGRKAKPVGINALITPACPVYFCPLKTIKQRF
jgi:hypothetical protein